MIGGGTDTGGATDASDGTEAGDEFDTDGAGDQLDTDGAGDGCVCDVIDRFADVVEVEHVRDGALSMTAVADDRSTVRRLVADLRASGASIELRRVARGVDPAADAIELEAGSITEKQREALELAVELGYYDSPRRADLAELAARLGVSKSAVSQRLNAAEATLVRELVGR